MWLLAISSCLQQKVTLYFRWDWMQEHKCPYKQSAMAEAVLLPWWRQEGTASVGVYILFRSFQSFISAESRCCIWTGGTLGCVHIYRYHDSMEAKFAKWEARKDALLKALLANDKVNADANAEAVMKLHWKINRCRLRQWSTLKL